MPTQGTLSEPLEVHGVGIHSGAQARVRLLPAPVGFGRRFVRVDLPDQPWVPARLEWVQDTRLATTLARGQAQVSTVEHLLAAALARGIDNLLVEVSGPEVPILDGSAQLWWQGMAREDQGAPAQVLTLQSAVRVQQGERWVSVQPASALCFEVGVHFDHPAIGTQRFSCGLSDFDRIASARTFGFLDQVEQLHAAGRALGAGLDNAVVFDGQGAVAPLRFEDEPVRHKVLDLVGDLALLGLRLQGRVCAERPGHGLTHALLHRLLQARGCPPQS